MSARFTELADSRNRVSSASKVAADVRPAGRPGPISAKLSVIRSTWNCRDLGLPASASSNSIVVEAKPNDR